MAKKKPTQIELRTPIVTVMGHVDHGKTSLLDALRGTNVTAKEAGGITQNTRAHQVVTKAGHKITFIDTPGHEAFSVMRQRGAQVTDFVLLVVAADDGVQPQTKESIQFAKDTNTPIIVAINKVDVEGVKLEKVKKQLASFGVNIEEYGGDSMCFAISATKKIGLDELVEGIELLAEVTELKPHQPGAGAAGQAFVLESAVHKNLGPVALCILKAGSADSSCFGLAADEIFKVRSLLDEFQKPISTVQESDPFWVTGLKSTVHAGETIQFVHSEKEAQALQQQAVVVVEADETTAVAAAAAPAASDIQTLLSTMLLQREATKQGVERKILNLIVHASTEGTLEVVTAKLKGIGDDEKEVRILSASTGEINESDLKLAASSKAVVIGFQTPPSNQVLIMARNYKVLVRNYEVIYEMIDELSDALESLVAPAESEVEVARARVKKVFTLTNGSVVAGSEVTKGTMLKGYAVYVERPSQSTDDSIAEIGRGKISSLRILKEEVREVKKGQECGISISPNVENLQEGDEVVAYKLEK